jgi:hypothetical protein
MPTWTLPKSNRRACTGRHGRARAGLPIDDLQLAGLAVAIVTALGERAAVPLEIARGDIVEHRRAVLEMALGQRGFDLGLTFEQPVERGVEFIFVDLCEIKHRAEAGGRCGRIKRLGGGERLAVPSPRLMSTTRTDLRALKASVAETSRRAALSFFSIARWSRKASAATKMCGPRRARRCDDRSAAGRSRP